MASQQSITDTQLRALLGTISHDLRNPLAAIVTNLEFARRLAQESAVDIDLLEAIVDSVTACDVLRMIVSNLDMVLKSSSIASSLHEVTVTAVVREVAGRCRPRAEQAEATVVLIEEATTSQAILERNMFGLAVENLLANSIQHAPRGSELRVTITRETDHVSVHFDDNGTIVPSELRGIALSPDGHTPDGRRNGSRYSRGLGLLTARIAAAASGADLILSTHEGMNRFTLRAQGVAPRDASV